MVTPTLSPRQLLKVAGRVLQTDLAVAITPAMAVVTAEMCRKAVMTTTAAVVEPVGTLAMAATVHQEMFQVAHTLGRLAQVVVAAVVVTTAVVAA